MKNEKKRIGILAANNIRLSPYIFFYTKILEEIGIEYEIIYPQRNGFQDEVSAATHTIQWIKGKSSIENYFLFRKNAIKIIKKEQYDGLIVLTTVNAALFGSWLKKHYKNRYIIDIRDYTYEDNKVYYHFEKIAVKNSLLNVISSEKFKTFLPKGNYTVCFNTNITEMSKINDIHMKKDGKLVIGYVGAIAYVAQCKALMRLVEKDDRFLFCFFGTSPNEAVLKEYAKELSCDRIQFFGAYKPDEKAELVCRTDILFNAYGNNSPLLTCALSNKLSDAALYKKVVLNSPNTFMHEKLGCCSYAMDLNNAENMDGLFDWYYSVDEQKADAQLNELVKEIILTNKNAKNRIVEALTDAGL